MNRSEKTKVDKILQLGRIAKGKLKRNPTGDIQSKARDIVMSFLLSQRSSGYIGNVSLVYDGMDIVSISGSKKEKDAIIASLAQISNYVRIILNNKNEEEKEVLIQQIHKMKRNERLLVTLTKRDPLTDLINRKTLETQIETLVDGSKDVVFMMFDLVKFKYINDIHGHLAGDNTLILFAEVCREFYNNPENGNAIIARTGGDEFIGIFIGKTIEEGRILAYKFRELLALRYRENTTGVIPVETSIGVSSLYDGISMPIEVEQKDSNKVQTPVEKLVSMALKKADILAHVAKNNPDNIATIFTMDLLNTAKLSEENAQLGAELSGILRHWISDEGIPDHIRKIRQILLPFLSVHDSIDEINIITAHITTIFKKNSTNFPHGILEAFYGELESLRNHWIQSIIK